MRCRTILEDSAPAIRCVRGKSSGRTDGIVREDPQDDVGSIVRVRELDDTTLSIVLRSISLGRPSSEGVDALRLLFQHALSDARAGSDHERDFMLCMREFVAQAEQLAGRAR
jgi:hypothetical protein